ncbi:MAG: hypothetical protein ACOCT9_00395 [archaeon]
MKNLIMIALSFILVPFGFVGNLIFGFGLIFEEILVTIGFMFLAFFTYLTFHHDYKPQFFIIIAVIVVLGIIHFILQMYVQNVWIHDINKLIDIGFTFLCFSYLSYSAYAAYLRVKEYELKGWIILRYKLLSYSAFLLSFQAIPELMMPYGVEYGTGNIGAIISFGITATLALIFSICNIIAWIMPQPIKNLLISESKVMSDKDLNEEEIMETLRKEIDLGKK